MQEYLSRHQEELPLFLKDNRRISLKAIKEARIFFYPGAGSDIDAMIPFIKSKSIHTFILCDYLSRANFPQAIIRKLALQNYQIVKHTKSKISSKVEKEYLEAREERKQRGMIFDEGMEINKETMIFEQIDKNQEGEERFLIIYYKMDGVFLYKLLFNDYKLNLDTLVVQDHGFGANYTSFDNDGLLKKMADKINIYPRYIFSLWYQGSSLRAMWDEFSKIDNLTPHIRENGDTRYLFEKRI